MRDAFYLNISTTDNLGVGFFKYMLLPERKFLIMNAALVKLLGYESKLKLKEEKLDKFFVNSLDKESFFKTLKEEKRVKFFETIFKDKSGRNIWVAITASSVSSKNKAREYLEGIIEDISAHKEMETQLAFEKDFLQGLLDNIPDAIYFKDDKNRIIKVNAFYAQGMKLRQEEIIGKTDFDFFPAEQAEKMFADDNYVLSTGRPIVGKIERTLLPNGTWNQVITTKIPMYDKAGEIVGTMGITRDMTAYANLERQRLTMLTNGLAVLGKALEMRDPYTYSHTQNVANIALEIAKKLGWEDNRLLGMRLSAELHDLGKISIPLDILNKPGKLSDLEYGLIQEHVRKCYELIKDIEFPFPLADIVYQHHERLDGSGYPKRLKKDEILLEARILAVSDVLESMSSHRPYREALGLDRAVEELQEGSGLRYDSKVVDIVSGLIEDRGGREFWLANSN